MDLHPHSVVRALSCDEELQDVNDEDQAQAPLEGSKLKRRKTDTPNIASKRVSPLWLHFEDDGKRASCLYCNSKLVHHSSTTPLKNHLSAKHPEHLPPIFQSQGSRIPRVKASREILDRDLTRALIRDLRPLSEMEGALASTICSLFSNWDLPKREVFRQNLHFIQNEYQEKLNMFVSMECSGLALALEVWSLSRNPNFHYACIYGHFMTRSFQVVSVVLGVEYLRDLEPSIIAEAVIQVLASYSLAAGHVSCIVAPCSPDSVDMHQVCTIIKVPFEQCLTSFLKQVVHETLLPQEPLLNKVRSIVAQIKCDHNMNQRFLAMQVDNPYPLPLLHDHPSRLLSGYDMLVRLGLLRSVLNEFIASIDPNHMIPILTDVEWYECESIAQYLLGFKELSEELNSERYLSGSSATVSLSGWNRYQQDPSPNPVVENLRYTSLNAFSRRVQGPSSPFILATALDPRWKHLPSWSPEYVQLVHVELRNKMENLSVPSYPGNEDFLRPFKKRKRFAGVVEPEPNDTDGFDELAAYQHEPRQDPDSNPIDWWIEHSNKYPKLALLARRYLGIPASATSSTILTTRRAALGPSNLRMMVMLNRNMDVLDAIYSTIDGSPDH